MECDNLSPTITTGYISFQNFIIQGFFSLQMATILNLSNVEKQMIKVIFKMYFNEWIIEKMLYFLFDPFSNQLLEVLSIT